MKLSKKAFGISLGFTCGAAVFVFMLVSLWTSYAQDLLMLVGPLHPGFSYSYTGAIWMAVLHFIMGYIFGWIIAWVYNRVAK